MTGEIADNTVHYHPFRIYVEDTDHFGLVYHANYVKFFDRGRTEWLRARSISLEALNQKGVSLVVRSLSIDYLKPAYLDDELIVHTHMISRKLSLAIFEQRIVSVAGDVLATVKVKIIALDSQQKVCRMSDIVFRDVNNPFYVEDVTYG
tara:strand:+ start:277 stop:723 length:447 start_codon:yes stop_codon:yes gene_type:complete